MGGTERDTVMHFCVISAKMHNLNLTMRLDHTIQTGGHFAHLACTPPRWLRQERIGLQCRRPGFHPVLGATVSDMTEQLSTAQRTLQNCQTRKRSFKIVAAAWGSHSLISVSGVHQGAPATHTQKPTVSYILFHVGIARVLSRAPCAA